MIFVNLKKILVIALFILSAGALFVGYSGWAVNVFNAFSENGKKIDNIKTQGSIMEPGNYLDKQVDAPPAGITGNENESFFVEYRLQRDRGRSQQVEMLKDILNTAAIDTETKKAAQEQLLSISNSIAQESRLEHLLKANGYRNAVVCIDQKGVSIVLDGNTKSIQEHSELMEIVSKETGIGEQGIIISIKE